MKIAIEGAASYTLVARKYCADKKLRLKELLQVIEIYARKHLKWERIDKDTRREIIKMEFRTYAMRNNEQYVLNT